MPDALIPSIPPGTARIPDRAAVASRLAALVHPDAMGVDSLRPTVLAALKSVLEDGRRVIRDRFLTGNRGDDCVIETAALADAVIGGLADFTAGHAFPTAEATAAERFAVAATGGYGRGELAPFSDIDLLFLLPYKRAPRVEQMVEYMLYMLWDLGWKVGHAVRSVDECIRQAREDMTVRTAMLEARWLWGETKLFADMKRRFAKEVTAQTASAFIDAKLAERDARHTKMLDSRYVLEPNVKEGKGGLRDLQTLFWIAKYAYQVDGVDELVARKVLLPEEAQRFAKAQSLLLTVRCHLHYLAGRQEDRLTFDVQPEIARRLGYTDHAGTKGNERLMKHYFLVAKDVGDLTRIFCAALEQESRRPPRFNFLRRAFQRAELDGFKLEAGRLDVRHDKQFRENPVDMIRLFHTAQEHDLDIHPNALRVLTRSLSLIGPRLREDAEANRLFEAMLTNRRDPELALRRMNEAGVLGRFVPDFGRIVALMQFDMYHHFTVDEHTLFALGILHRIETGALKDDVPLATQLIRTVNSRRALYVGLLCHDIAKGRGGDHSILGAKVAEKLGPRLGLTEEETETAAWLVRWHLSMSDAAFKKDLDDPKTIRDFVDLVQSPERLKLLYCLTVADIRAVGPGRWNNWKATLLRQLYDRSDALMLSGTTVPDGQERRVESARAAVTAELGDWPTAEVEAHLSRGYPAYWLAFDTLTLAHQARLIREAERAKAPLSIDTRIDRARAVTEVTIYTADHPGLFSRLAGALALAGADIVDARIFTMANGMALDIFFVQAAGGGAFDAGDKLARLSVLVEKALSGEVRLADELARRKPMQPPRSGVFRVAPRVLIDNKASTAHTVIELNGRDRPGLLYDVTRALTQLNLQIASAKISTFGNMAVDVFYVKDVFGLKVTHPSKLTQIRTNLLAAIGDGTQPVDPPKPARAPRRKDAAV